MISSPTRIVEITDVPVNIRKTPAFLDDPDAYPVTYATLRYASGGSAIQLLGGSPFAKGMLTFVANPTDGETIKVNAVTFTFTAAAPAAPEDVQIGDDMFETARNFANTLNASVDGAINVATYKHVYGGDQINIVYDTAGTGGNAFGLEASSGNSVVISDRTLTGGQGYGDGQDIDADTDFNDISQDLERYAVAAAAGPTNLAVTDWRA